MVKYNTGKSGDKFLRVSLRTGNIKLVLKFEMARPILVFIFFSLFLCFEDQFRN